MTNNFEERFKETRKLQITGGSTHTLSLPRDWVRRNQLRRGSPLLLIEEEDGSLSIRLQDPEKRERRDEAFIRVTSTKDPGAVARKVVSAFLVGYNIIHVKAQSQQELSASLRDDLRRVARDYLVGTEILVDTPSELTLQVLLNYQELSVDSALRRISMIASSMYRDAMAALWNCDHAMARAVVNADSQVDRFYMYMVRLLKLAVANPRIMGEIGLAKARDDLGYRLIIKYVERTADRATSIAESALLLEKKLDGAFLGKIDLMSNLAISMFEEAMSSLFKHDFDLAESVIEKKDQIVRLEKEAVLSSQSAGVDEVANLRLLIESVRRTAEYALEIAQIVLNLNVESVLG